MSIEKEVNEVLELEELDDESLIKEIAKKKKDLLKEIDQQEIKVYLSGTYDRNDAILEIYSGAGGVDAQDWATMLLRMFQRYCQKKNFKTKIIHQSFGEGGGPDGRIGTKTVTLEVKGLYAYGTLKKESGAHRLVRQSPFSAKDLRHTSFAQVEVMPKIDSKINDIEIKDDDLKIDLFRSSGPGGQNVNKRETAVRITHLPTNTVVSSQSERNQGLNKEKAMDILYSKLYKLAETKKRQEIANIKEDSDTGNNWGTQIRSYVLHPYKLVKDNRTGIESSNPESVLDGDLDRFIEAEIKT